MAQEKQFQVSEQKDGTIITVDFYTPATSAIIQQVIESLYANTVFIKLILNTAKLNFEHTKQVLTSIQNQRNIREITLRGINTLTANETVDCVEIICSNIATLNLAINSIDTPSALKIAQFVCKSKVTTLMLSTRRVDIMGFKSTFDLLKNSTLKILHLDSIRLDDKDAGELLDYLKSNTLPFELRFSRTEFSKAKQLLICEALQEKKLGVLYIPREPEITSSSVVNPYKLFPAYGALIKQLQAMGNGLLWEIPSGSEVSYVYATLHSNGDNAIAIAKKIEPYIKKSTTTLVETDSKDAPCITTAFPIYELISGIDYSSLLSILASSNVGLVEDFCQPWAIQNLVVNPEKVGEKFIDQVVVQTALDANLKVVPLENVADHVRILGGYNAISDQIKNLLLVLNHFNEHNEAAKLIETQYLQFDLIGLLTTFHTPLRFLMNSPERLQAYQEHIKKLIDDRDTQMVAKILPHIKAGGAFVAVGASHLLGILLALKSAGFNPKCVAEFAHRSVNDVAPKQIADVVDSQEKSQEIMPSDAEHTIEKSCHLNQA